MNKNKKSSLYWRKQRDNVNVTNLRIVIIFSVLFLFGLFVFWNYYNTIITKNNYYKRLSESQDGITLIEHAPRGKIFDRNMNLIVDTIPAQTIYYLPKSTDSEQTFIKLAKQLSDYIKLPVDSITTRNKKDYLLLSDTTQYKKHLTKPEYVEFKKGKITLGDAQKLVVERIPDSDVSSYDADTLNQIAIFSKLSKNSLNEIKELKDKDITQQELDNLLINQDKLQGIIIDYSWKSDIKYKSGLVSILGRITNEDNKLTKETFINYLQQGFSLDDSLGIGVFEKIYNTTLHGKDDVTKIYTLADKKIKDKIQNGSKGKDIVLNIDIALQEKIDHLVENQISNYSKARATETTDMGFILISNPKTGEIYAASGKQYLPDEKKFIDFSIGNFSFSNTIGSTSKAVTQIAALETGALKPGDVYVDKPLSIPGSKVIGSYMPLGRLDDRGAIAKSSNVYHWMLAIKMGDGNYIEGKPLNFNYNKTVNTLRKYQSMFGLGLPTGIEIGNEASTKRKWEIQTADALFLSVGLLDTYTNAQLNQMDSTFANGKYRLALRLIDKIGYYNQDTKYFETIYKSNATILNNLEASDAHIERVRDNLHAASLEGTCRNANVNDSACKTGTAQDYLNGREVSNKTIFGFAPFNDPNVAISISFPHALGYWGEETTIHTSTLNSSFSYFYDLFPRN